LPPQNTIVYADLDSSGPHAPSAIAESIARASEDSLIAGQFDFALKPLQAEEIRRAFREFPSGHERLSLDGNLVLLDAGAMLAYAPYRSTILLSADPFEKVGQIQQSLRIEADLVRVRLHDALLTARKVIALGHSASLALAPLLPRPAERRSLPSTALAASGSAILVVRNDDDHAADDTLHMLSDTFGGQEFSLFDASTVFERNWKLVVQLGIAQSSLPGARLSDAWAGGVPVVQLVNPVSLRARRRRQAGPITDIVVEHGKSGLLCTAVDELRSLLADLLSDVLPARAVARGARNRVDPAGEWDILLKAIAQ